MSKTVQQALIDEVMYPIPIGLVDNIIIKRGLDGNAEITQDTFNSHAYIGALADCLYSLVQAISVSESDKSIGTMTDAQMNAVIIKINKMYSTIGEEEISIQSKPMVYINC